MPKYIVGKKTYNIPDDATDVISSFEQDFPDAKVEYDTADGIFQIPLDMRSSLLRKYPDATTGTYEKKPFMEMRHSAAPDISQAEATEAPQAPQAPKVSEAQENNQAVGSPVEEQEYIRGFGAGFKQGAEQLGAGLQYATGEVMDRVSETALDNAEALETLDRMVAEGRDVEDETKVGIKNVLNVMAGPTRPIIDKLLRDKGKEAVSDELATDRTIRRVLRETDGDIDAARALLEQRSMQATKADELRAKATETMREALPTKGAGAWMGSMVPQMVGTGAGLALSALTKSPLPAQVLGMGQIGLLTASTAGSSMMEAREAGASGSEIWAAGVADAGVEFLTERIPFKNYLAPLVNQAKAKVGKTMAEAVANPSSPARKELQSLLEKANKQLGGKLFSGKTVGQYIENMAKEGASEFVAEALQTITPMMYQNPEDYPTFVEIFDNGIEGLKGGIFMGSILGGASQAATHRMQRERRKEQGFVNVAEVKFSDNEGDVGIVEVVDYNPTTDRMAALHDGEMITIDKASEKTLSQETFSFDEFDRGQVEFEETEAYNNGRAMTTPQEKSDAILRYEIEAENMRRLYGLAEEDSVDDFIGGDPYAFAQQQRDMDGELGQATLDYLNAKSAMNGILDAANDRIDETIAESDALIESRKSKTDGFIHPAVMRGSDKKVYIVSGNVNTLDDGSVDVSSSDESIIIMDEEGNTEFASPRDISSLESAIDPEAEKATVAENITTTLSTQAENEMDGVLSFMQGDKYTLLDGDGVQHSATILADNGNNTVSVLMDNETEPIVIQKDEVQAMSSAFNTERVRAQIAEEKVAKEAFTTKVVGSSGENEQNREIQAPAEEVAERVIPTLENGQPDFNSMDADMFVEEYASRYGEENTIKLARKNIASARESIKKIDKKIDEVTDPNDMQALFEQKRNAEAVISRYSDVLDRMGVSEDMQLWPTTE